jgi:hypothetical protein
MSVQSSQRIKKVASHQLPHLASGISTAQGTTEKEDHISAWKSLKLKFKLLNRSSTSYIFFR